MKIFDAHFHIIDPRFPLFENQGYRPPYFTIQDYKKQTKGLDIIGGAVVAGSFQGVQSDYLTTALKELGPNFVGVIQLDPDISDLNIMDLHDKGIRGIRFNLKRGGAEQLQHLTEMACRVHDLVGWHVELYIDSKDLGDLKSTLLKLPAVSIDHLGLTATGQKDVLDLAEKGVKIKASGFGRIDVNIEKTLTTIYSVNPEALLFGTDLPGTRAKRPFEINDLEIIQNLFDQKAQHKILSNNAKAFYKIKK